MATRRGRRAPTVATACDGARWRRTRSCWYRASRCFALLARETPRRRRRLERTVARETRSSRDADADADDVDEDATRGDAVRLVARRVRRARRDDEGAARIARGTQACYGAFASDRAGEAWVVARGDANETRGRDGGRLRRDCCEEALLRIDLTSGDVLEERSVESKFTHDATRRLRGGVFVADTGRGRILELEYPSMKTRYIATLTVREHVNTVLPANVDEYGEHAVWAVLHNLGPSGRSRVDRRQDGGRSSRRDCETSAKSHTVWCRTMASF